MRTEKSILLFLIVISTLALTRVTVADSTARIYVHPETVYAAEGESAFVDIDVADVENLHTWQVKITFDPEVIQFVNVTEGDFLEDQPEGTWTTPPNVDNIEGSALFAWYTQGQYPGVSGEGWLATVEFLVLKKGESALNITHSTTYLLQMKSIGGGYVPEKIPCTRENGYLNSLLSQPVAEFTFSPARPRRNDTVMFNASASDDEDGYIVSYEWDFGDGTPAVNETDPITDHAYTTSGRKTIILNVTDDTGLSSVKTKQILVSFAHDVAIVSVEASSNEVVAGETVSIDVVVTNLGEETESFNVIFYYGETELDTKPITNLAPDADATVVFSWDTAEVAPGHYTISAEADLEGDGNPTDNVKAAGTVTVELPAEGLPLMLIIAVVIIVAVVAIGAFVLIRRRGS